MHFVPRRMARQLNSSEAEYLQLKYICFNIISIVLFVCATCPCIVMKLYSWWCLRKEGSWSNCSSHRLFAKLFVICGSLLTASVSNGIILVKKNLLLPISFLNVYLSDVLNIIVMATIMVIGKIFFIVVRLYKSLNLCVGVPYCGDIFQSLVLQSSGKQTDGLQPLIISLRIKHK